MSPNSRKITGFLLLAFLALPTQNSLAQGLGQLALVCAAVGYAICGLGIWGAIRLVRPNAPNTPKGPTP